jgi:hypothetical protein
MITGSHSTNVVRILQVYADAGAIKVSLANVGCGAIVGDLGFEGVRSGFEIQ